MKCENTLINAYKKFREPEIIITLSDQRSEKNISSSLPFFLLFWIGVLMTFKGFSCMASGLSVNHLCSMPTHSNTLWSDSNNLLSSLLIAVDTKSGSVWWSASEVLFLLAPNLNQPERRWGFCLEGHSFSHTQYRFIHTQACTGSMHTDGKWICDDLKFDLCNRY